MSWLNRKKKQRLSASNRLTNDEHQELERVLMNCQIEPVSDLLIPYLSRMKGLLREYQNGKIIFEERFKKICNYLEGLKQNPKYVLNEFKQKAHINALTLLGSIKIMVSGLSDEVNRHNPKSEASNSYFIKRLPPNLRLYLSPDSWRLYEVYALLYQSENHIFLNKDLLDDFPKTIGSNEGGELNTGNIVNDKKETVKNDEKAGSEVTPVKESSLQKYEESKIAEEAEQSLSVDDIFNEVLGKGTEGEQP